MPDLFAGQPHNQKAQPAEECQERTWSSEKPLQPPLRPAEVPPVRGSHMVGHLLFSASVCKPAQALSSDDASTEGMATCLRPTAFASGQGKCLNYKASGFAWGTAACPTH